MHPIESTTVFIIVVLHSTATVGRRVIKDPSFLQKYTQQHITSDLSLFIYENDWYAAH